MKILNAALQSTLVQSAFFCLTTLLMVGSAAAQVTSYAPKVGQAHPDFILPSVDDGKPIELSSFRGKKVLLMHFASW